VISRYKKLFDGPTVPKTDSENDQDADADADADADQGKNAEV